MIRAEKLTKYFDDLLVLDSVDCKIEKGKITVFIGPSGTGKTVFLKTLVGLLRPSSGRIFIGDADITKLGRTELYELRKKIGMLFQDGALFDSMNIIENVAFPLKHHTDLPLDEIMDRAAEKLVQVGLAGLGLRSPAQISGGMRKRVALARAIALDPEIVLLDEPTSGLDPVIGAAVDELILEMQQRLGSTFVVISHDIDSTIDLADKIGMFYQAKLIAYGDRDEILQSDNEVVLQYFSRSTAGPIAVV